MSKIEEEELVDYEEEDAPLGEEEKKELGKKKGSYAGIHSSGFRDFLLKPDLLKAIADCGFEHPSTVQQDAIPQAMLGTDIICQAKAGMGKTAVFVLSTIQLIEPVDGEVDTLVLCHTRELAYQISQEFRRFAKYFPDVKICVFYGGVPISQNQKVLKEDPPHIVVGTPGRVSDLVKRKNLDVSKVKRFIVDECDHIFKELKMRRVVQEIFKNTPREKQVMLFSATLDKSIRPTCRKFTKDPAEIYVDDESKLVLHGLIQHSIDLAEKDKTRKLSELLDALEFNQVVIFVSSVQRCIHLNKVLNEIGFPCICVHGRMKQEERLERYSKFKEYDARILVATDIFGRGVDFERVNIVINYDLPRAADLYLHRVGRSGRFDTKGLAISFVSSELRKGQKEEESDQKILQEVQDRFSVKITDLPEKIDTSTYMNS